MSTVKVPTEKKRLSLAKDRRNLYGPPTLTRKNISRDKQRSHMDVRRAANEELRSLKGSADEVDAERTEARAKARVLALELSAFKKPRDVTLAKALAHKSKWRAERAKVKKSR